MTEGDFKKFWLNSIFNLSVLVFVSALVYKLYSLNWLGVVFSLLVSAIVITIKTKKTAYPAYPIPKTIKEATSQSHLQIALPLFYSLNLMAFLVSIWLGRTDEAIISPWLKINKLAFVFYFLANLSLIFILLKKEFKKLFSPLLSLHFLASFSVAILAYRLGYGFDSFIHQATLELIDKTGSVSPKPFYYLGQYGLSIILHKIFFLPLALINKILVPLLAALSLPAVITFWSKKSLPDKAQNNLIPLLLLVLTYPIFILSTPQNLAFIWLIWLVFLFQTKDLSLLAIIALAGLAIHPLAGLPAFFFLCLAVSENLIAKEKFKNIFNIFVLIVIALVLPVSFLITNKANLSLSPSSNILSNIKNLITIPYQNNLFINTVYLYGGNLKLIIAVLAISGFYLAKKKHKLNLTPHFLSAVGCLFSFILLKNLQFQNLINYEQSDYANRALILAVIFSLPAITLSLSFIMNKIFEQTLFIRYSSLFFLSTLLTTSLYLSYPRQDDFFNSRGYSTGRRDFEAVSWIEKDSQGEKYLVLANQQVSTAALSEFGFSRYLKGDNYFYPIPTGGKLYQYYLKMVYEQPTAAIMKQAMQEMGVNQGYFVLNKYWWAFPKVLEEAKLSADSWQEIGENEVYVFKFSNKKSAL